MTRQRRLCLQECCRASTPHICPSSLKIIVARQRQGLQSCEERSLLSINEHHGNELNAVFARYRKIIVARQRQGLRSYEERSLLNVNEHRRNEHNAVFARYNGFLTVCLLHPLLSDRRTGRWCAKHTARRAGSVLPLLWLFPHG